MGISVEIKRGTIRRKKNRDTLKIETAAVIFVILYHMSTPTPHNTDNALYVYVKAKWSNDVPLSRWPNLVNYCRHLPFNFFLSGTVLILNDSASLALMIGTDHRKNKGQQN